MRATYSHFGRTGICIALGASVLMTTCSAGWAQSQAPVVSITVQGHVRDTSGKSVVGATVSLSLQPVSGTQTAAKTTQTTYTDSDGSYRFAAMQAGSYTLHAELKGLGEANIGPVPVATNETKTTDLTLSSPTVSQKPKSNAPEFFDEPQFTVAGVTQASNSGGHGSDTVIRTTEALAKATVSLSNESTGGSKPSTAADESTLRSEIARNPEDASLHHRLGDVEEELGNPLAAVREYQRAAELDPSEPNLFDWGTELLAHRALEAATEVFVQGNRLFPKSVRMLVALGVSWYARGSYDQALKFLEKASDLDPDNPDPYLFLGRMQSVAAAPLEGSAEKLARFAQLHPENALANYYYAVSLWKQSAGAPESDKDSGRSARIESLLLAAVRLDPKLGQAYLQLGILYAQRPDISRAIAAFQKAIEVTPAEGGVQADETLEEAHYRLARIYSRVGDDEKAKEQLQLRAESAQKTKDDTARERKATQEFVISLRSKDSVSTPHP
jgi:tetratricopeptide (TPR) repeat protein